MKATLPILALAILVGCGPDVGPTNPEDKVKVLSNELSKASDLLPVQTGNAWTYSIRVVEQNTQGQSRQTTGTPTLKVTGVNGSNATLAFVADDKLVSELGMAITETGVVQRSIRGANGTAQAFNPAIPMYIWPMEVGEKREWEGEGLRAALGDRGPMTSTLEYKGEMEVDSPAGRMKAHRFDTVTKYTKDSKEFGSTQSVWLVPKVGIVRSVEIIAAPQLLRETEMKLESYTVK